MNLSKAIRLPLIVTFYTAIAIHTLPANADTGFSDPLQTVNGPAGLLVTVYHRGLDASLASPPTFANLNTVLQYANTNSPDYAFLNTNINNDVLPGHSVNYAGAPDGVTTSQFLGADAAGPAASDATPLNTTIIDQRGYIYLPVAGTYTFTFNNADDAAAVYIGGNGASGTGTLLLAKNFNGSINGAPGLPSPVHVDIFNVEGVNQTGWYPFELVYFNQYNPSGGGNAGLNFTVTGPGQPQFAAYTVSPPIPLHRYSFLNTDGAGTAFDTAPADARNGVLTGGAAITGGNLTTTGPTGQGARLGADALGFFFGSFSIEQWFTRANNTANFQTLFSFSADTAHYLVAHPARGGSGLLSVDFNNGAGETSLQAPAPAAGVPTMLTVTYDAATNIASLYLNGHFATSHAVTGGYNIAAIATPTFSGINGLSPWGDPSLNGTTDEFRMWREPLTPAQIIQHYVNGPSRITHP